MRYKLDAEATFAESLLFWLNRYIRNKLTTLSNRQVKDSDALAKILLRLNKETLDINALKALAKEARNIGLIGINTYINPLEKLYKNLCSLGLESLKEIDEEMIADFLAASTSGLSDATKKNYRIAMISFFGYIEKQNEEDEKSHLFRIELKKWGGITGKSGQKLPAYMIDNEIERFLEAIDTCPFKPSVQAKNRLLIKTILYSGMRVSEALGLTTKEITLEEGFYVFRVKGKGNKPRIAMIKERYIAKDMTEWLEKRRCEGTHLFCNNSGTPLSQAYVSKIMEKILLHAGIRKEKNGAHMLRHTFATRLYQKNRDLVLVQEALGHADLNTSRIYTHFDKERLKAAASALDDL